jgi:hypothetical protein
MRPGPTAHNYPVEIQVRIEAQLGSGPKALTLAWDARSLDPALDSTALDSTVKKIFNSARS